MLVKLNLCFLLHLRNKLNGKTLYEIDSVRYLGIQIDKRLTWKHQINYVALKVK